MRRLLSVLLVVCAMLLCGCGIRATDVPIPGTYLSGAQYRIRIEFGSVLNLPDRAKVISDGVDVGVLDRIDLIGNLAVATVDLRSDVQLPVGTTAELRQSTILGDIHIALTVPKDDGGPFLGDNDTIPLAHTLPAANVEDILRALSNIVTGGRFAEVQELVRTVNSAFPDDPADVDRIVTAGKAALHDLGSHTADLDRILAGAASVSATLQQHRSGVDRTLELGPSRAAGLSDVLLGVVRLLLDSRGLADRVGDLALPFVGDFRSLIAILAPALRTISTADITVAQNVSAVDTLLREKLIPFFSAPPNIRIHDATPQAIADDAAAQSDRLVHVLRSIGMVR